MEQITNATENITLSVKGEDNSNSKDDTPVAPSKSALKKAAKEAEKAKKRAETAAKLAARESAKQEESVDVSQGKYGVLPLIQSTSRTGITTRSFIDLSLIL